MISYVEAALLISSVSFAILWWTELKRRKAAESAFGTLQQGLLKRQEMIRNAIRNKGSGGTVVPELQGRELLDKLKENPGKGVREVSGT